MRALLLSSCLLLLMSCAARDPATALSESKTPTRVPVQVNFEREISGRILSYDLQHPAGVAVDAQGNLFVSDGGNHRLIKFDNQFEPVRDYGGYGGGIGKFIDPAKIVIDRGLNLYVLDVGNRRIVHLDAKLNFVEEIFPEDDPDEIISNRGILSGLQISPLGEITVADYDNSRLIKMDNFHRFSRYIGGFGYGRGALLNPKDLAMGDDGRTYVADAGNGRVAIYDDYGNYLGDIGAERLKMPVALTVSKYGTIWVVDREEPGLYAFAPNGRMLMHLDNAGIKEYSFAGIEAMTVSPDGRLYFADGSRNRILIFDIAYEGSR